jgi:transposase-like protein
VKRLEESSRSLQEVADELGIHANQLRGWRTDQRAAGSAEALAITMALTLRAVFRLALRQTRADRLDLPPARP